MDKSSCKCKKCIACCWHNPGWFGNVKEIEEASKIKKISVTDFCKEYLIREWHTDKEEIYIPSPRRNLNRPYQSKKYLKEILNMMQKFEKNKDRKGFVVASWGHNIISGFACIFLTQDNLCSIHKSRPYECKITFGCKKSSKFKRNKLLLYWEKHQDWIENNARNKITNN